MQIDVVITDHQVTALERRHSAWCDNPVVVKHLAETEHEIAADVLHRVHRVAHIDNHLVVQLLQLERRSIRPSQLISARQIRGRCEIPRGLQRVRLHGVRPSHHIGLLDRVLDQSDRD